MNRLKFLSGINWKSKFIDLLIVIIGISIAFKLNTWNESLQKETEAKGYLESFMEESRVNRDDLLSALEYSRSNKQNIDTLRQLLLSGQHSDPRIRHLAGSMLGMADFSPFTTTMESISASGKFDLINDMTLRKTIITTYTSYQSADKMENLLTDYVDEYVTPYMFEHVRFRDFTSIEDNYLEDPVFENIVFGYSVLLDQQIQGYRNTLEKVEKLMEKISLKNKVEKERGPSLRSG